MVGHEMAFFNPTLLAFSQRPKHIAISMDGRGRALDNVFIERLWWTLKYEELYPKCYDDAHSLHRGLSRYFASYNHERKHTALDKRTPADVFMTGAIRQQQPRMPSLRCALALRAAPSGTGSATQRHHGHSLIEGPTNTQRGPADDILIIPLRGPRLGEGAVN